MRIGTALLVCFFVWPLKGWATKCPASTEQELSSSLATDGYISENSEWDNRDLLRYFVKLASSARSSAQEHSKILEFLDTAKVFSKMTEDQILQFYLREIIRLTKKYGDEVWLSWDAELTSVPLAHLISRGNYDVKKWIGKNQELGDLKELWQQLFKLPTIGKAYHSFFEGPAAHALWDKWISISDQEERKRRWNIVKAKPSLLASDLPPDAYFELNGIVHEEQNFGEVLGDLLRLNASAANFKIEDLGPHPGGDDYGLLKDLTVIHDQNSVEYRPGDDTRTIAENGRSLLWLLSATQQIPHLIQNQHYDTANGLSLHLQTSFPKRPWVYLNSQAYYRRLCEIKQVIFLLAKSLEMIAPTPPVSLVQDGYDVMEIYTEPLSPIRMIQGEFGHFQVRTLVTHPLLQWELQTDWAMLPQKEWEHTVTQILQALVVREPQLGKKIRALIGFF